jgi:glycosyltransferase involved in cell wall biosynthesis
MVTVYTRAHNESFLIGGMVRHYLARFPGCQVRVYDDGSTDGTGDLAKEAGALVLPINTGGQLDDIDFARWKSQVWHGAATDWVVVCDVDEWLDITSEQLQAEAASGNTVIRTQAWHMVTERDGDAPETAARGVRDSFYDKVMLWNKRRVQTWFKPGAHVCALAGEAWWSKTPYLMRHMKYMDTEQHVTHHKVMWQRLSGRNKAKGLGHQYSLSEQDVRANFAEVRRSAVAVPTIAP